MSGAAVEDWEAVAVGACPSGSCIYVADIGDNDAKRKWITVYRIPEPSQAKRAINVSDVYHATYPDGAHDAESLLVTPDGRLHIVTKGNTGPVSIYRFPDELRNGTTLRLERVGGPRHPRPPAASDRITDGAVSPDGRWIVLRGPNALTFYRAAELQAGNWREAARVPLAAVVNRRAPVRASSRDQRTVTRMPSVSVSGGCRTTAWPADRPPRSAPRVSLRWPSVDASAAVRARLRRRTPPTPRRGGTGCPPALSTTCRRAR